MSKVETEEDDIPRLLASRLLAKKGWNMLHIFVSALGRPRQMDFTVIRQNKYRSVFGLFWSERQIYQTKQKLI